MSTFSQQETLYVPWSLPPQVICALLNSFLITDIQRSNAQLQTMYTWLQFWNFYTPSIPQIKTKSLLVPEEFFSLTYCFIILEHRNKACIVYYMVWVIKQYWQLYIKTMAWVILLCWDLLTEFSPSFYFQMMKICNWGLQDNCNHW